MGDREYLKSKILQNQKLPPLTTQAKNLGRSIINNLKSVVRGNSLRVSVEEAGSRMAVCRACPNFIVDTGRCSLCSCFMNTKTTLTAEHCPIKKW